jgi:iron complex outermembrane receptor protein
MSKVMNTPRNRIKARLLTTASAVALTVSVYLIGSAEAADVDRPLVWIELGGQFEQFSGQGDTFAPPFISTYDWGAAGLTSPAATQSMHVFSYGGEGSISFQPSDSDWVFSAAVRYGRSHGARHVHEQPQGPTLHSVYAYYVPGYGFPCCKSRTVNEFSSNFEDTRTTSSDSHIVLDFQVGKDVGLGMFGHGSTSVIGAGIRFAQFRSRAAVNINAREDVHFYNYFTGFTAPGSYFAGRYSPAERHRDFVLFGQGARSFGGLGPSLTWNASAPFVGNEEDGEVTIDWGVNAAILFGKQKSATKHQTSGYYVRPKYGHSVIAYPPMATRTRSRNVMVPNVGGFAGLSFRYSDAKLSLGYRGDFFFGAIDAGIDTRREATRAFYGPFASISVGLGD